MADLSKVVGNFEWLAEFGVRKELFGEGAPDDLAPQSGCNRYRGSGGWLSGYIPFWCTCSIAGYSELIALCPDLRCSRTIGKPARLAGA